MRRIVAFFVIVSALVWGARPGTAPAAASQSGPVTLQGSVPSVVQSGLARPVGKPSGTATLSIAVALKLHDPASLDRAIANVSNPHSALFRRFLTQDEFNSRFAPTSTDEQTVIDWLQAGGLTVTHTYSNRLLVDAQGSIDQIERLLNVSLVTYTAAVHGANTQFYAPKSGPTVSGPAAAIVQGISGLDNLPRIHAATLVTNGRAHGTPPYYPQDFANAYDVGPLWTAGAKGTNQRIGITMWTAPPTDTALRRFSTLTSAAPITQATGRLHVVKVDGGSTVPDDGEAGMDIEYSGGMAPGAFIDYYEAPTDANGNPTDQGIEDALNLAGTDNFHNQQITNSWGECEPASADDSFVSAVEAILAANSATGHSYFFSTGDSGSWCDPNLDGVGVDPYPQYPASSQYVTAVGGTRFSSRIGSIWPGESAWQYCDGCYLGMPEGTGGGYSAIFGRPSWQTAAGMANNGDRGYPDIAADGDPNTGAMVCYGAGVCAAIGGTSLSSPLWAGMLADINSYLAIERKPPAGFLSPTLYALAASHQSFSPFHDVTAGTNGVYNTSVGWDAVTGLGSPDVWNLARDIAAQNFQVPPTFTPTPNSGEPTDTPVPTGTAEPTTTPTATPTSTPMPSATPTATPVSGTEAIANGGFEQGTSPWVQIVAPTHPIVSTQNPHNGAASALFCGYQSCSAQLYQTVTVPATFTNATLGYWFYSGTGKTGSTCLDNFYSRLRSSTGATIMSLQHACNATAENDWEYVTYDLTSRMTLFRGRSLQIYFMATTRTGAPTDFYVDDATLTFS